MTRRANAWVALLTMAAALMTPSALRAQQRFAGRYITQARFQIDSALNADSAAVLLQRAMSRASRPTREDSVSALLLLAATELINDRAPNARLRLRQALALNADVQVDHLYGIHPAFRTTLEGVRADILAEVSNRARDSLNAGTNAYGRADFDAAVRLLPFGLVNNLAARHDQLWVVGVQRLADALIARGRDSLATTWLRWALREYPDIPLDTTLTSELRAAVARARESLPRGRGDPLTTTTYEWGAAAPAGQGSIRLVRGPDSVRADIRRIQLTAGTGRALASGTYTIRFSIRDSLYSVERELLPNVTTVLQFRYAPPPAGLAFRSQPQGTRAGGVLGPVAVAVVDAAGNTPNATTRITISLGTSPTGAALSGRIAANAVGGVATFTDLRVDRPGRYTLTATAGGLSSATSTPFEVTPVPARLAFRSQPPNAAPGAIQPAFQVVVQDSSGNVVANGTTRVTLALATSPSGATVRGRLDAAPVNGVATFDSVRLDRPGRYTLTASSPGLIPATSSSFDIAAVPGAARLAFRGALPSAQANGLLAAIEVVVQDSAGNPVTTAANSVTLGIATNTAGASLLGRRVAAAVNGIARFDSLRIAQAGRFALTASSQGLAPATSATFEVAATPAAQPPRGAAPIVPPAVPPAAGALPPSAGTQPPAATPAPSGAVTVAGWPELLSAGTTHSCAVTAQSVACWGDNGNGQVGDGTRVARSMPVAISLGRFASVSTGEQHTCTLRASDSTVTCWGRNNEGQLGNGQNVNSLTPMQVAGARRYLALSAGARHTCALGADSLAYCWGANDLGQLGNGTRNAQNLPSAVQGSRKFVAISAGAAHTCAIAPTGALFCWGQNDEGQLGDGTTNQRSVPNTVFGAALVAAVSAGANHTCAVGTSGSLTCWGGNDEGQLGDSSSSRQPRPVPVRGPRAWITVSAGEHYTCAVTSTNDAYCWGNNDEGQLGFRLQSGARSPVPRSVSGINLKLLSVTAGRQHTCGVLTDGRAFCWGSGERGRLGNGGSAGSAAPLPVTGVTVPRPSGL